MELRTHLFALDQLPDYSETGNTVDEMVVFFLDELEDLLVVFENEIADQPSPSSGARVTRNFRRIWATLQRQAMELTTPQHSLSEWTIEMTAQGLEGTRLQ